MTIDGNIKNNRPIIKSRERVSDFGEVFTSDLIVNKMLKLVNNETERLDSNFLEQACGDGNFLMEILNRKIKILKKNKNNLSDQYMFEKNGFILISSIYGIDILNDNVKICIERLYNNIKSLYEELFSETVNKNYLKSIKLVLEKNIIWGDALTMNDMSGKPIIFFKWTFPFDNQLVKVQEYVFSELYSADNNKIKNESGEMVYIPKEHRDYNLIHYLKVSEIVK